MKIQLAKIISLVITLFIAAIGIILFVPCFFHQAVPTQTGSIMDSRAKLSPELQKITDHSFDYPYSKDIVYPDYIYSYRKNAENDIYDEYIKIRHAPRAEKYATYFIEDAQVYKIALKIGLCEELITDDDMILIQDRISKRFNGSTLLEIAVDLRNLQAIDMLFKYGADPYMSYSDGYPDAKPASINFLYEMHETFNSGFSVDAIRLYLKHGYDPNYLEYPKKNSTFLSTMVTINNELAWTDMLKAGGDPWHKIIKFDEKKSIAADAASLDYFPFLDYLIYYGYIEKAKEEDVLQVIDQVLFFAPGQALYIELEMQNRQRILRELIQRADIVPTKKMIDYMEWKPPVTTEGYRNEPQK